MTQRRKPRKYTDEIREDAVKLVTEQGYTVTEAAKSLGITTKLIYNGKDKLAKQACGEALSKDEKAELIKLRKENKRLLMEREILKKRLLCERNEIKFDYIQEQQWRFPISALYKVLQVSRSAYYAWLRRPVKVITADELKLYRRMKRLFVENRGSAGARTLMKLLRKEDFAIGICRVKTLIRKLGLIVKQRVAYQVTTIRKHSHAVADNLLNRQFNPSKPNQAWAGDITYLRTHQDWMYLAVVMDLHSSCIIGWLLSNRMTVDLTIRAMQMAINLRQLKRGLLFHSDRGSQYTSKQFQALLWKRQITPSMSGCGACLDNAVVERFFSSLKNEWLLDVYHLTRESMKNDVEKYIKYYISVRLHTSLNDMSPIEFESVRKKCATKLYQNTKSTVF